MYCPFYTKHLIGFLFLTLLLVLLLQLMSGHFFNQWSNRYTMQALANLASMVRVTIIEMKPSAVLTADNNTRVPRNSIPIIEKKIRMLGQHLQARITLVDANGKVVTNSDYEIDELSNHIDREEIKQALHGKTVTNKRWNHVQQQHVFYTTFPLNNVPSPPSSDLSVVNHAISPNDPDFLNKVPLVLRISIPMDQMDAELQSGYVEIFLCMFPVWGFAALIGSWFLYTHFVRPIHMLSKSVEPFTQGPWDSRVQHGRASELSHLKENVNTLALNIQHSYIAVNHQFRLLEEIIEAMPDPFLVMDAGDQIQFTNQKFRTTFLDDPSCLLVGQHYENVLRAPEIQRSLIHAAKGMEEEALFEWKDHHYYLARIRVLSKQYWKVCVFSDVTQLVELSETKRLFVSNVSHEFRTPLTAMRGFVETLLEDETDESRRYYLEILSKNIQRLSNLIYDLVSLGKVDSGNYSLNYQEVHLLELVQSVMPLLTRTLQEKGLQFESEIPEGLVFQGDSLRIEQIVINLLNNAIRYTEKGKCGIRAKADEQNIIIEVYDTGIGIPEKKCEHIFEPFYVVDKSRSRELGGNGLGLSIVQKIVQLHHGKIEVSSQLQVGTTFTVIIPLVPPQPLEIHKSVPPEFDHRGV